MAQFAPALEFLLDAEDRGRTYKEVIDNNGGRVIAGINSKSYPEQEAAIASAPESQKSALVYQFYFSEFWLPLKLGGLESQDVANRVLSAAVNCGMNTAIQMLQQAVNLLGGPIGVDGHIGPITLAAANSVDPERLLAAYRQEWGDKYRRIAAANPNDEKYLKGWLARAKA